MINRRYSRPSRAVENLQQLSLNSSAGIDCTRPHNDTKSVYASKNLVVNTDGSLSLRKPIVLRTKFNANITRVIPLPEDAFIAVGTFDNIEGFLILNSTLKSTQFRTVWHDVYGNERVNEVPADTPIPANLLNISECHVADTASGVVLSDCALSRTAKEFPGTRKDSLGDTYSPIFDAALYDDPNGTSPRLVNVYYDSSLRVWCVKLHIPVPTNYLTTDSGVEISRDTLLDNPFAVRDAYDVAVPSVKAIRAYAYTAKEAEGVVLADRPTPLTATHSFPAVPYALSGRFVNTETVSSVDFVYRRFEYTQTDTQFEIARVANVAIYFQLQVSGPTYRLRQSYTGATTVDTWNFGGFTGRLYAKTVKTDGVDVTTLPDFKIEIPANVLTLQYTHQYFTLVGAGDYVNLAKLTSTVNIGPYTLTAANLAGSSFEIKSFGLTPANRQLFSNATPANLAEIFEEGSSTTFDIKTSNKVFATLQYTYETPDVPTNPRVADLTESVKNVRYRAMDFVDFDKLNQVVLKAFLNIPTAQFDDIYCSWRYTLDGVTWEDALADSDGVSVTEPSQEPITDVSAPDSEISDAFKYKKLLSTGEFSNENLVSDRADCLTLTRRTDAIDGSVWDAVAFKFKLVALETTSGNTHVKATYGETLFYEAVGSTISFEESDIGNAASGKQLYSKSRLYSFGDASLKNNILYSYANEFETPLTNVISLAASSDNEVTTVVRWRNSLISATEHALYLSEQQGDVFYTKTLNTAIGIPKDDGDCCVPVLNGVIFKSGNKIYQLYPNVYSDDGTTLNVTDISQSISHYLDQYSDSQGAFAFSTESEYVLMLPAMLCTRCLRYDYTTRVWTYHEYSPLFKLVKVRALNDIRLIGTPSEQGPVCEFLFDTEADSLTFSADAVPYVTDIPYGDIVTRSVVADEGTYGTGIEATVSELEAYLQDSDKHCVTPIAFELDTGQKTDAILTAKQFVESKMVFATLSPNDSFPMQVIVHVDGDPHITTKDISTDAPFWENSQSGGALNTLFGGVSSSSDNFNVLRQLIVRYSGKGKSVRHILTGESLYNFKLYETYARYKLLNVKQ